MKLFGRTGGYWIFYISAAYFVIGMIHLYIGNPTAWLPPLYIFFLSMPFWFPPLGRAINLNVTWDKDMFDWFKKKDNTPSNVVPFPEPKAVPKMPEVQPPKQEEEPAKIFYRIGVTDKQRVAFSMGYSEITMNKRGVQQMIDQLTVFMDQIEDEDEELN